MSLSIDIPLPGSGPLPDSRLDDLSAFGGAGPYIADGWYAGDWKLGDTHPDTLRREARQRQFIGLAIGAALVLFLAWVGDI